MAVHGKKRHLKRQNLPLTTGLKRKGDLWVAKPSPGKHSIKESITLVALLRDKLSLTETSRQAKKLLNQGEVLVDGVKAKKLSMPVGLMDVISIPKIGLHYRVSVLKGILSLHEISAEASKTKYCRVKGKKIVKKGKVQLNLHDARNVLIEREEDRFKTGDTVLLSIPKQEIKGFLKMEKGAKCLVFKGKHAGEIGVLEEVVARSGSHSDNAKLKVNTREVITLKEYLMVVDKNFDHTPSHAAHAVSHSEEKHHETHEKHDNVAHRHEKVEPTEKEV